MKILDIHLINDEDSRTKAVAEVELENGIIIHEVRVIESDGVLAINPVNHGEYEDEDLTDEILHNMEMIVLAKYKELI